MNHTGFSKAKKSGSIYLKDAQLVQESLHLVVLVFPDKYFALYMIIDIMGHGGHVKSNYIMLLLLLLFSLFSEAL